uniref:Reverse transcriptase/retrotransposon-derived protein RNase H-like domain-containing protein n=1 Tax=Leptobrachium leishanense TaxID=445787 RepID=A0A8C5MVJ8_9ANUR
MFLRRSLTTEPTHPLALSAPPPPAEEQMQIGLLRGHLPVAELNRRRQNNLCLYCGIYRHVARLCPEKSSSRRGFILKPGQIEMDPEKINAIASWPQPTSKKEVQRFTGFSNFYRKFIRSFSKLIKPLTDLTKQGDKFQWTEQTQDAFQELQRRFTTAPILTQPDTNKPFYLEVDASETATGAVLSQRSSTDDHLHPIANYSKRLTPAENNYDVGDKELLAIKRGLEEW